MSMNIWSIRLNLSYTSCRGQKIVQSGRDAHVDLPIKNKVFKNYNGLNGSIHNIN